MSSSTGIMFFRVFSPANCSMSSFSLAVRLRKLSKSAFRRSHLSRMSALSARAALSSSLSSVTSERPSPSASRITCSAAASLAADRGSRPCSSIPSTGRAFSVALSAVTDSGLTLGRSDMVLGRFLKNMGYLSSTVPSRSPVWRREGRGLFGRNGTGAKATGPLPWQGPRSTGISGWINAPPRSVRSPAGHHWSAAGSRCRAACGPQEARAHSCHPQQPYCPCAPNGPCRP